MEMCCNIKKDMRNDAKTRMKNACYYPNEVILMEGTVGSNPAGGVASQRPVSW